MAQRRISVKNRFQQGIALITALLVLVLISSIIVGLTWLVMTDGKLGNNNADREVAFYGAESGLETMTAALSAAFDNNYDLSAADINQIMTTPPTNLPSNIQFWDPINAGNNGYVISFTPDPNNNGNPLATNHTILSGQYSGLVGLLTPYTLTVTARTSTGSEVKLQRLVQTAAIPVFQFGIFSQTDLSFFAGPDFDFGGRVHTNGNLWLAENGGTLTLEQKTTAAGEVIRTNLENGYPTTSSYNTTVDITKNPGSGSYAALSTSEGSTLGTSSYGAISSSLNEPAFANLASGTYNGNLGSKETGVTALNLGIATPSIGGQPIDLIRLPLPGEAVSNPNKLSERYYSQASLRILLSDYGPSGTCVDSDITTLPDASPNETNSPVDLSTLAWDSSAPAGDKNTTLPYSSGPISTTNNTGILSTNIATNVFPLPVSGATTASYSSANGYWQKQYYPVIQGCLKIDYQTTAGGAFVDTTWEILNQGYTGLNIDPLTGKNGAGSFVAPPTIPALPTKQINAQGGQFPIINTSATTVGCTNPSTTAIIRLARLRDNPSTGTGGVCGTPTQHGTDYWPNVLFDTREGTLRDTGPTGTNTGNPTIAGAMYYVELDVANLAAWLKGHSTSVNNVTGYTVYFSDRRGDQIDTNPPPSVNEGTGGGNKTGAFGYDDFVNPSSATAGCPNSKLDQGEDVEGDYNTTGTDTSPALRLYGNDLPTLSSSTNLWILKGSGTQLGSPSTLLTNALTTNAQCTGSGTLWPWAVAKNNAGNELRENPPLLFRRALKLVDGATLSSTTLGTCDSVPCGLTIVAENPVYVQGDYNDGNLDSTFASTSPHVACAVIADAVTLLSDYWNDVNSFAFPYNQGDRAGNTTMYRTAIVGGKGIPFLQPSGTAADFGTDGGMHNFLRYLETWNNTLHYNGSLVNMYYSEYNTGTFKCCTTVYSPPTRNYYFDVLFLTPANLPPATPEFQDVENLSYHQNFTPQ